MNKPCGERITITVGKDDLTARCEAPKQHALPHEVSGKIKQGERVVYWRLEFWPDILG